VTEFGCPLWNTMASFMWLAFKIQGLPLNKFWNEPDMPNAKFHCL